MTTPAGAAMALDQRDLADVVRAGPSRPARPRPAGRVSSALVGAWFSMTPMTRARHLVGALRRRDVEIVGAQVALPSFTVFLAHAGIVIGRDLGGRACRPPPARTPRAIDHRRSAAPRGPRRSGNRRGRPGAIEPSSRSSPKCCGGVERRHLDRGDRLQPLRDGVAHDAVHVAFVDQRAGMAVVGAQDEVARIEALLRSRP